MLLKKWWINTVEDLNVAVQSYMLKSRKFVNFGWLSYLHLTVS